MNRPCVLGCVGVPKLHGDVTPGTWPQHEFFEYFCGSSRNFCRVLLLQFSSHGYPDGLRNFTFNLENSEAQCQQYFQTTPDPEWAELSFGGYSLTDSPSSPLSNIILSHGFVTCGYRSHGTAGFYPALCVAQTIGSLARRWTVQRRAVDGESQCHNIVHG